MTRRGTLAALAMLSGCYATVQSSSAHLTQATAAIPQRVGAASEQLVRLFAARSISLVEEKPVAPDGARRLRLIGDRRYAGGEAGYGERHAIDSVYYARVEPTATGASVQIVGKPAVDGVEACTADPGFALPCSTVRVPVALAYAVDGYQEAQVIHNLLVELALASGR